MMTYDKDHYAPMLADALEAAFELAGWIHPDEVGKASCAGKAICYWAYTMHLYGKAVPVVEPLRRVLRKLEDEVGRLVEFSKAPTVVLA